MYEKPLVIVGIDPGTTVGYAMIDLEESILEVNSSKELNLNILISRIISSGKVLAAGCDKKKAPEFVERFAVKTGARLSAPKEDLLIEDKRAIAAGVKFRNDHELDALASALFAFRNIEPLLKKIDNALCKRKKEHLRGRVIELVVKKGMSITASLSMIEMAERDGQKNDISVKARAEESQPNAERLKRRLIKIRKDKEALANRNKVLKQENRVLRSEVKEVKNRIERFNKDLARDNLLRQREAKVVELSRKTEALDDEIDDLRSRIKGLRGFLARLKDHVPLKKLSNLGSAEWKQKKGILNICDDDVLLVDDPSMFSKAVISIMEGSVRTIIHKRKISWKIAKELPFKFIRASELRIIEIPGEEHFALAEKKELEKAFPSTELVKDIISQYRKGRSS